LSKPPFDRILAVDFETSWGREVKLGFSCQTNEEYLRDPRFKAWGLSWKEVGTDNKAVWVRRNGIQDWADSIDWTRTALVCQNTQFDGSILSWHYGVQPCFMFDTLSMGRALHGVEVGNSLKVLAERYGLPPKGDGLSPSENILDELPFDVEQTLADYCKHDTWLCEQIFLRMLPGYPSKELRLIDLTLRMYTRPLLVLDGAMLEPAIEEERQAREELLTRLGVEEAALASNDKFAAVLEGMGVEPPTKVSKTTGEKTFAFAKNDALFQAMMNSDNEAVALLCEARLMVKSTLQRTRAQRFLDISRRGPLPFPVNYYGAATGRYTASKGSQINLQNLKRGSFLRKAITAPEGHVLVVGDLSQIEPRVLAWLADYGTLLDIFKGGGDPYATFGAGMFNIPGMTKDSHPVERQSAKSALLGCGYQLGWASFAAQLLTGFLGAPPKRYTKAEARQLGVTSRDVDVFIGSEHLVKAMEAIPHSCTAQELLIHCLAAQAIITRYRATAQPVVRLWELFQNLITHSLFKGNEYRHKCLTFRKEEIVLPNGMSLRYPDLKPEGDGRRIQWTYADGKKRSKLYAGKITNNCLAAGTPVLTARGWVPIESVEPQDLVHDGVEFVRHAGKILTGVQGCVTVDGVLITPEHLVLTDHGWEAASQVQEPFRPDLRHVDGVAPGGVHREVVEMALPLRMRRADSEARRRRSERNQTRGDSELRLYDAAADRGEEHHARYEPAPRLYRLAQHACAVLQQGGSSVQKLWRKGGVRLREMAQQLRGFLGRHGRYVCARLGLGSYGQQRPVLAGELSMGVSADEFYEQTHNSSGGRRTCAKRGYGHRENYVVQPTQIGLARGTADAAALVQQQVYDIVNCGPRNRFVVKGATGPFIVHNCVQGTARIVMTDGMLRIDKRYPVAGTVHDEAIAVAPESEADDAKTWVLAQMTIEPSYLPGIPLSASGGVHKRYGLAKD
jgi:DNA polymerase